MFSLPRATLFGSYPKTDLCWTCHTQPCLSPDHFSINLLLKQPLAIRLPLAVATLLFFPIIALVLYFIYTIEDVVLDGSKSIPADATHVPTFYAPKHSYSKVWHPLTLIVTTCFGAIHCTGWNFIFPTHQEGTLWRLSSIVVTTVPLLLFTIFHIVNNIPKSLPGGQKGSRRRLAICLSLPFMLLYVAARLVILGLAITLLRRQPPSAFTAVNWTGLYPHIS